MGDKGVGEGIERNRRTIKETETEKEKRGAGIASRGRG